MNPLGNLQAFVQAIADAAPPALSYANPQFQDLGVWRAQARAQVLELLRYAPPAVDQAPEILESVDCGGYIREKLRFSSAPWSRIPAYLLIPKGLTKPAPAIAALHCHGGYYVHGKEKLVRVEGEPAHITKYREGGYGGQPLAETLVARGYVVAVIDAFYFGERRLNIQELPEGVVHEMQRRARFKTGVPGANEMLSGLEELMARHLFAAGATWLGVLAHDDRATVSLLAARPEVDASRIGCAGLSMGAHRANYLHATDPRVRAAVSVGWMTDWRDLLPGNVGNHSWTQYVPGLGGKLELSDLALLGEGAYMAQSCAQDDLFPLSGMQSAQTRIRALFEKAGMSERFDGRFYDVPHRFNPEMQRDACDWLDRWLQPNQA